MKTFDELIHGIKEDWNEARFASLTEDKGVSSYYAGNRLYMVRKFVGKMPVFAFIECGSDKEAQEEMSFVFKQCGIVEK